MKINRLKKIQKNVNFYVINFGFREPFQIIIDATFCQAALQNHFDIREQLPRLIQKEVKLFTTPCIIIEAEKLGGKVVGATMIVKKFTALKCGHEKSPISGSECMKAMVKKSHFIIASQDLELQSWIRRRPGQPLVYLHLMSPVFDEPSESSKKVVRKRVTKNVKVNASDEKRLEAMKKEAGLPTKEDVPEKPKPRKKKGPNPLSCKAKKRKNNSGAGGPDKGVAEKVIEKKQRVRKRVSRHIREHLKVVKAVAGD